MVLLGILVVVAALRSNKRRRREKRKEIERKVYEKKALRVVSMVADSRVFFACATRTLLDSLELECVHHFSRQLYFIYCY